MSKDAIVLIHGFNHDHRCWDLVVQEIQNSYLGITAIAVDMPGRGKKESEKAVQISDAVASIMCDIAQYDRVFLVGHSFAGVHLPVLAAALGEDRILGQMYIACAIPPQGHCAAEMLENRFLSGLIKKICRTEKRIQIPWFLAKKLFCNTMTEEKRKAVKGMLVPEPLALAAAPVDRSNMPTKNLFWVRTLRDNIVTPKLQAKSIENLGEVEIIDMDAPHNVMISHPRELADLIITKYEASLHSYCISSSEV